MCLTKCISKILNFFIHICAVPIITLFGNIFENGFLSWSKLRLHISHFSSSTPSTPDKRRNEVDCIGNETRFASATYLKVENKMLPLLKILGGVFT